MAECLAEVNVRDIIVEVMEEKGASPDEVAEEGPFDLEEFIKTIKKKNKEKWSERYFRGRAKGQFKCNNELCERKNKGWSSIYAWCILDLKDQKVKIKIGQKCTKCQEKRRELGLETSSETSEEDEDEDDQEWIKQSYKDEESVRHMVEWAVNLHLYLVGKQDREPIYHKPSYRKTPEHKSRSCKMCKLMGVPCNMK